MISSNARNAAKNETAGDTGTAQAAIPKVSAQIIRNARNVKFYLRDDLVEFVDEVSGESAVRIGRANWICPYCNQQNDDAVDVCAYCSAPRTESKERYHDVEPPKPSTPAQPAVKRKKKLSGCALGLIGCGGMLLILFIAAMISIAGIRTLSTLLMVNVLGWGLHGVWLGILADQLSRFIMVAIRFKQGKWVDLKI